MRAVRPLGVLLTLSIVQSAAAQEPEVILDLEGKPASRPASRPSRQPARQVPARQTPEPSRAPAPGIPGLELPIEEDSPRWSTPYGPRPKRAGGSDPPAGPGLWGRKPAGKSKRLDELRQGDQDALDRVLDELGGISAFQALELIELKRALSGLNGSGQELFRHVFTHTADLDPDSRMDEIKWSQDSSFGRQGGRTWARSSGIDRPDLEPQAGKEIEAWSFLLRFPFGFRDRSRYEVESEERVELHGQAYRRLRILEKTRPGANVLSTSTEPAGSYDLYLDPVRGLPILMEMHKQDGRRRRIAFSDYRALSPNGPTLPRERTVMAQDGESPSLLIQWSSVRLRKKE
ncbi:MAG: hypothetical protein ACE5F1_08565 [Planctomycetota bacterium]